MACGAVLAFSHRVWLGEWFWRSPPECGKEGSSSVLLESVAGIAVLAFSFRVRQRGQFWRSPAEHYKVDGSEAVSQNA